MAALESMKHLFRVFSWVLFLVGGGLTGLASYQIYQGNQQNQLDLAAKSSTFIGAANSNSQTQEKVIVEQADSRPEALAEFIARYNPKLLEEEPTFNQALVDIADKYKIDFRLLPAISMKESGLCKVIPDNSYNCLGLGVHSQGTWEFDSYEENFDAAARILKKNYIDIGLVTPEEIMTKYTPSSPNGEWAKGVNQFMSEIRYNDRNKGIEETEQNSVTEFAQ